MLLGYGCMLIGTLAIAGSALLYVKLKKAQTLSAFLGSELERLKAVVELSQDVGRFGIWHLDTKTGNVDWSGYVFDMHHRPRTKGNPTLEEAIAYYAPEDQKMVRDAVTHAMIEGEDFEFRSCIVTETGEILLVLARGTCQFNQNGKVIGVFGCFVELGGQTTRN